MSAMILVTCDGFFLGYYNGDPINFTDDKNKATVFEDETLAENAAERLNAQSIDFEYSIVK